MTNTNLTFLKKEELQMAVPRKRAEEKAANIDVVRVTKEALTFYVVGTSPFVCNAMSAKVRQYLLCPPKRKTQSERETTLKHEPLEEYRRSAYRSKGNREPTRVVFPAAGFKRAMSTAALELPGVNKTQIGRLCWAEGPIVHLFGIPQLWMTVVRSADKARTPDVRTRAILPEWAASFTMEYVTPNLNQQSIANLIANAGMFIGVGDGRPEKGALSFGRFEIVAPKDPRYVRIIKAGGRKAQDAAFKNPTCYDTETDELLDWWKAEKQRRGFKVVA